MPAELTQEDFQKVAMPYLDEMYASALRLTRRRESAEDLVSDVYSRAWKAHAQFTPGTNMRAWLYKILTNTYINQYRKTQREPLIVDLDKPESEDRSGGGALYEQLSHSHPLARPDQVVANRFLDQDLKQAIESLPEEFRMVVLLSDVQSFSYQDIADMLEIPIGTVRSRLWRGRRILQKTLWDQAVETGVIGVQEQRPS